MIQHNCYPWSRRRHSILFVLGIVLVVMIFLFQEAASQDPYVRGGRILHDQQTQFNVQLFLDLQFVEESLALDFETLDKANANIIHFCNAIQAQIFGTIVTQAAKEYNATFVEEHDEKTDSERKPECNIVATSRVYDPEAEDVFGAGHFSLQVHISQQVVVESSNQTLYLEVVQSVIETGFDVVSGGQREFRNHLYEHSSFRSVLAVSIRRGLTAPVSPPSLRPTTHPPTRDPTREPSPRPSWEPTLHPTREPTRSPTNPPTPAPSRKPTASPTFRPTRTPSMSPSESPSDMPSTSPSGIPSLAPSTKPSAMPSIAPSVHPSMSPSVGPTGFPTVINFSSIAFSSKSSGDRSFNNQMLVAGLLGASVVIATMSCLGCFLCYRFQRKKRRYTFPSPVPLSQRQGNYVPGVVELGVDLQSLADTTLGDPSAGGNARQSQGRRPYIRHGLGSFDESSLYTTPFDEPEPRAKASFPLSVQSSLSGNLMTPLEYEDRVVFPSDSVSEESNEGVELPLDSSKPRNGKESPVDTASTVDSTSVPIDIDSNQPYYTDADIKITKIEPLEPHPSNSQENDDFSKVPSDLDVWSCDFEDFDRGSDFYKGEDHSKAPSLTSSVITRRINNVVSSSSLLSTRKEASASVVKSAPEANLNVGADRYGDIPPKSLRSIEDIDAKRKKSIDVSSIALRLRKDTESNAPTPKINNVHKKESIKSPEEGSQSSKTTSMSALSTDTKTGAPTIDCLNSGIVDSLKDGVTTIDSLGNGIVNALSDSLDGGIVSSVKDRAPHIERLGNGLVSSLTDIFDRMAIPKITPEGNESLDTERTSESKNRYLGKESKEPPHGIMHMVSDDDSGVSASPWLMEKIEDTLGPKSVNADMASLTSKSLKSRKSEKSRRTQGSKKKIGSEVSHGTRSTYNSRLSRQDVASIMSRASLSMSADILAQQTPEEISFARTSRSTLEDGIKRLELQLAALDQNDAASSVTMSSVTWGSFSTISARSRTHRNRRRVLVVVPPGRLGVILADHHNGQGTTISSIKPESPVAGILKPGDRLVAVDEIAVVDMSCSQITSLIAARASKERRFTVMTTVFKREEEATKTI